MQPTGSAPSFTLFGRQEGARLRDVAKPLVTSVLDGSAGPTSLPDPPPLAAGSPNPPSPRTTPSAGSAVEQPATGVTRYGRVTFRWNGGDPSIDAARGKAFVTLEHRVGSDWKAVGTEDGVYDTTVHANDNTWTETWQFTESDPVGSYRFHVTGVADRGSGPAPYELTSNEFELGALTGITAGAPTVTGGVVHVRALYPDPGNGILVALPRLVRSGGATVRIQLADGSTQDVTAHPDPNGPDLIATLPDGATVQGVTRVEDAFGNTD